MDESKYNKQSVALRRILDVESMQSGHHSAGDYCFDFDAEYLGGKRTDDIYYIYLCLPGEIRWSSIQIQRGAQHPNPEVRIWGWDGNEDAPTITPSIHWVGHWHGHLNAGFLQSC